jgi:hypothetical protein
LNRRPMCYQHIALNQLSYGTIKMAAIRGYAPRTSLRQRVRLLLLYMAKIGASGGYCLHTNILIKSQMPVYCSFTRIKNLYLLLSTNYNHLTTLYPCVNNVLKKYSEQINFI